MNEDPVYARSFIELLLFLYFRMDRLEKYL